MRNLVPWFPAFCSRLKIFLCYAKEDRVKAVEIGQTLTNSGHDVFMDVASLETGGDFNAAIRRAIANADRFVFIISKASVAPQKFTLAELSFAKERWPAPNGIVFPIQIEPDIDVASLPAYLRLIQIHTVVGNAPAETAAIIEKSRAVKPRFLAVPIVGLALAGIALLLHVINGPTRFTMGPISQVDFRPYQRPGSVADAVWYESSLRLTLMPIEYANEGRKLITVNHLTVSFPMNGSAPVFHSADEVDLKPDSVGCEQWLCSKGVLQPHSADDKRAREVMFQQFPQENVKYGDLVRSICAPGNDWLDLAVESQARANGALWAHDEVRSQTCRIALKPWREKYAKTDCDPDYRPRRRNLVFNCQ